MYANATLILLLCCLLSLTGCGPRSEEDFRAEGLRVAERITLELKRIRTYNQLIASQDTLTALFDELVDLMIRARELYPQRTPDEPTQREMEVNADLQAQLRRVGGIDGGLQVIERCQHAALQRLDRFEQELAQRKQQKSIR